MINALSKRHSGLTLFSLSGLRARVLCSLLLFKSIVRRSAERRYALRFPPVCRNIHPRRSQSAATFVLTILDFLPKRGLTKIRTYG